jgi:hypothetical protein
MADDKSYLPDSTRVLQTITFHQAAFTAAAAAPSVPAPTFRILRTNELDPYEKAKPQTFIAASAAAPLVEDDSFGGTDRRKAKLSIADAKVEKFADLSDLLDSLVKDATMANHKPKITRAPTSDRVAEEKRNVSVDVWLYAASRENDNDFHIIVGRDPEDSTRRYMNAEVSGLPPANSNSRAKLAATRKSFQAIVQQQTPGLGYDFYDPPIAITVQGSLFFDVTHATGSKPGPASAKPKTVWEIHPITSMKARTV